MASGTWQVGASADDAHELQDGTGFTATAIDVQMDSLSGGTSSQIEIGGMRFTNVTIPQGATINSATWEPKVRHGAGRDPDVEIYGEDVDNAADFTTTAAVASRTKTTASVTWQAESVTPGSDAFVQSPDITTIIQEIVNRVGWSSGNALMILVAAKGAFNRNFKCWAYDSTTTDAAKLNVDWTAAGGGLSIPVAQATYRRRRG